MNDPNDKNEAADELEDLDLVLDDLELEPEDGADAGDGTEAAAAADDAHDDAHDDLELPPLTGDADLPEPDAGDALAAGAAVAAIVAEEPVVETAPAPATAATAEAGASDPTQGTWVWQFGAPAPPPSFGAKFFSGQALGELYRFFACGLLVFIGCLLPWRGEVEVTLPMPPGTDAAVESVEGADDTGEAAETAAGALETLTVEQMVPGYEIASGAICLIIALWLVFASLYGVYTGRQKILPVFLMLEPAYIGWSRTMASLDAVADVPLTERFSALFAHAGTGVMLTVLGSTIVVVQLVLVTGKVMRKTPEEKEKAAARAAKKAARGDNGGKGAKAEKKPKAEKADKADKAGAEDKGKKGKRGRKR